MQVFCKRLYETAKKGTDGNILIITKAHLEILGKIEYQLIQYLYDSLRQIYSKLDPEDRKMIKEAEKDLKAFENVIKTFKKYISDAKLGGEEDIVALHQSYPLIKDGLYSRGLKTLNWYR